MQIDPGLMPSTLDAVHLGLAGAVVLLLILLVTLLTFGVVAIMRGRKVTVAIEAVPSELLPGNAPVRVTLDRVPAEMLAALRPPETARPAPSEPQKLVRPEPVLVKESTPDAALQLLGLLQKDARFLDFIQEDISAYSDADIGIAARVVHEGCGKVLKQYFELGPVRQEQESTRLTLPKGYDAASVRVTGNIVGEPPFTGLLLHRGWKVTKVKLPSLAQGHDPHIVAAAEVEL